MNNELYAVLASLVQARINCDNATPRNAEWFGRHEDRIEELVKDYMPSGSGVDCGTKMDLDASTSDKLVFTTSYHHMNESGMYDGWTEHTVTVTPSLAFGFTLRIGGRDHNDIKEYLRDLFAEALGTVIEPQAQPATPAATEGSV